MFCNQWIITWFLQKTFLRFKRKLQNSGKITDQEIEDIERALKREVKQKNMTIPEPWRKPKKTNATLEREVEVDQEDKGW